MFMEGVSNKLNHYQVKGLEQLDLDNIRTLVY